MKWFLKVLRQYADFSGRARRKEYWMFVLFYGVFLIAAIFIDALLMRIMDLEEPVPACYLTFVLAMILPALAVVVRRLHDTGRSGWWIMINIIPFVGAIWLLVLLVQDSQYDDNEYGENPKLSPQQPSEQARLTSVAVTVIVAAAWRLLVDISYLAINESPYYLIPFVMDILLLVIGILLFKNSSCLQPIEKARRKVSVLLIIFGGGMTVLFLMYSLTFFNIFSIIYPLYYLSFLFFAIALATSNRDLIKAASVILIIFAAVEICFMIFNYYIDMATYNNHTDSVEAVWHAYRALMPIFHISVIMLASVFMTRATATAAPTVGGYSGQPSSGSNAGGNVKSLQPSNRYVRVPKSEFVELPFNTASLSALKCPHCNSNDYIPTGTRNLAGQALATQFFLGFIGGIIASLADAQSVGDGSVQYQCKKCKRQFMADPTNAGVEEHLSEPCRITLLRGSNLLGAWGQQAVYLNGIKVGAVKNGKAVSFNTWVKENVVFLTVQGVAFPHGRFTAISGGSLVIIYNRKIKQIYNAKPETPTAPTVETYTAQPSQGSNASQNVEPTQTAQYEKLMKIKSGMTADELIAVAGLPATKKSVAEIFIPLIGKVPPAEEGKDYWAYRTPFGDFQVSVRNSMIVGTNGLDKLNAPPKEVEPPKEVAPPPKEVTPPAKVEPPKEVEPHDEKSEKTESVEDDLDRVIIRAVSMMYIADETFLKNVALNDSHWVVRVTALNKISDKDFLKKIALNDPDSDVRNAAEKRLEELNN